MSNKPQKAGKTQAINSELAAKLLDVNVSSIKRWTDNGDLTCHRTRGGHRRFFLPDLIDFAKSHTLSNTKPNLFNLGEGIDSQILIPIVQKDFEFIQNYILEQAIFGSKVNIQLVLIQLYTTKTPLYELYDKIVVPVLHEIGDKWYDKELTSIQEHMATQKLRDCIIRLQGLVHFSETRKERILLFNPSHEEHDIALKMAEHLMEERGFDTFFNGQITPIYNPTQVIEHYHPDKIIISSTFVENPVTLYNEIIHILQIAEPSNINLYLGGEGFKDIHFPDSPHLFRLQSLAELMQI